MVLRLILPEALSWMPLAVTHSISNYVMEAFGQPKNSIKTYLLYQDQVSKLCHTQALYIMSSYEYQPNKRKL